MRSIKRIIVMSLSIIMVFTAISYNSNEIGGFNNIAEAATGIHLQTSNTVITVGTNYRVKLLTPSGKVILASKITWTSSNKNVASVSKKGTVSGKKDGKVVITAKYKGKSYKFKATVKKKELYEYTVSDVAFKDQLKLSTENHKKMQEGEMSLSDFNKYIVDDPSARTCLTDEEIIKLRSPSKVKSILTYKQAVEDIDLYFRALKYGYGAYYYFGGDKVFDEARERMISAIKGKETISYNYLSKIMSKNMKFCRDGHFNAGSVSPVNEADVCYKYYYCYKQTFDKDENGFYRTIDGQKWYFSSFEKNSDAKIDITLLKNGKLVYCPVLFYPSAKVSTEDVLVLACGNKERRENFKWILSESYAEDPFRVIDYKMLKEDGITYISVRNFDPNKFGDELNRTFVADAVKAKDSKAILFDIRSNGGGGDEFSNGWVKNFSGTEPVIKQLFASRRTPLNPLGSCFSPSDIIFRSSFTKGNVIRNDVPIIVLVDDKCGSAGESALNHMRCMENVLIIGSNSAGCQIGGNVYDYTLPNSGMKINFGMNLSLYYTNDEIDGKGYVPDVWCNPKDAYKSALNLLENGGYISKSGKERLINADY